MRSPAHRRFMLALILLVLFVPTCLRATPAWGVQPATVKHVEIGLLDLVRSMLSVLWDKNGIILAPGDATLAGDNGSILDPSGRS